MKFPEVRPNENDAAYHELVRSLVSLPHKIIKNHEVDDLAQIVLHDISHHNHLGLKKATYLIDNPDFDQLLGVAGYSEDECKFHQPDVWHESHNFSHDMRDAEFHNNMRNFLGNGLKRKDVNIHDEDDLNELGTKLGLKNPSYLTWPMRHGNHGILLFEVEQPHAAHHKDILHSAAGFLSMCPCHSR